MCQHSNARVTDNNTTKQMPESDVTEQTNHVGAASVWCPTAATQQRPTAAQSAKHDAATGTQQLTTNYNKQLQW
jgi:hypothetical protein